MSERRFPSSPHAVRDLSDIRARQSARTETVGRAFMVAMTVGFIVVFGRVVQLQAAPSATLREHISDRLATSSEPAVRGDVLDRRGRPLAVSRLARRVIIDPTRFPEPYDQSIVRLAEASGLEADLIGRRVMARLDDNQQRRLERRQPVRYLPVGGVLDDARAEAVRALRMPGVTLERRFVREAVGSEVAGAIVGKVGFAHEGRLGAELALQDDLSPRDGALQYVHDGAGAPLWIERGSYQPPRRGEDVRLSVDLFVQRVLMEELWRGAEEADAAGARGVIIDPNSGEVLAMGDVLRDVPGLAELGQETLDERGDLVPGRRYRVLTADPRRAQEPAMARRRVVEDVYEPGSTFKPFLWAVASELGRAQPDEVLDTEGGRWRNEFGRLFEDVAPREEQTWRDVLVRSSNIGMAKVAMRMSHAEARHAVTRFGFGSRTALALPGEAPGLVTSPEKWTRWTQTSVCMGYELAVTPLQMARAFSAFARDGALAGALPSLRLTAMRRGDPELAMRYRVLPPWVAHLARDAMREIGLNMDLRLEQDGVANAPPQHEVFGKSGTSKVARYDGRGYFEQYTSSFVAGAPFDRPQIVVVIVIDDPGPDRIASRSHFGSAVAGPVVRRVVNRTLEYLGVAPDPSRLPAEDSMASARPE